MQSTIIESNSMPDSSFSKPPIFLSTNAIQVCDALALALADDPFYLSLSVDAHNGDSRLRMLSEYFALAWAESEGAGIVQLSAPDGGAFWHTPGAAPELLQELSRDRKVGIRHLLGVRGFSNYLSICESMERQLPGYLSEAWYLSILGVRPEARGRGLASQLLQTTLSKADAARAVSYLETFNPLSLPFYRRHGFAHEIQCFEPVTQRDYWLMFREPTAGH